MWEKIQNILATEEWFRFATDQALCRVWYVGRGKDNSIVVQATMEMYVDRAKVMRPTQQLVGAGTDAWATYRSSEKYRAIRTIVKVHSSTELEKMIGINFREERIYLSGIVLLGALEQNGDARLALCATARPGLNFAVGPATPQPKPATEQQEAAVAVAASKAAHQL
jgi:hypothetical protein